MTRRTFVASALALVILPASAAIVAPAGCEIPEWGGVVPVNLKPLSADSAVDPRCLPEDVDEDDEEVIEVSAIDLRGL